MLLIAVVASAAIGAAPAVFQPAVMSRPIITQPIVRPAMMSQPIVSQPIVRPVTSISSAQKPLKTPPWHYYNYYTLQKAEVYAQPHVFNCIMGLDPHVGITQCPPLLILVP